MTESVKKNKEIRTNRYFWIACIVLVLLQYGLCIHYGLKRQYLFCDEVYSYGLANSTDKTFLHPGEDNTPLDEWVTGSYFENYMNYNDDSFNYSAAYRNQENDVHPPVYYMLLHTVCYFFKGAGYSAVPGIVLNLILLIFVDILLLYVAAYLLGNRWYGLMAAALWGVSSVGISNCMLIRMYLLQTLNVLLLTAVHVYILRHKKKMTVPYFILLALAVMFGGLTHYYFYFYVAGLGLCVCIYLLYMRKVKQMFAYGFSLVAGFGAAIAVFPATIKHIFGYRGSYATDNLIGLSGHKFLYYISYINRSYFAGLLPLIVLVALVLIVARIVLSFVDIRISLVRKNDGLSYRVCTHRRDIDADRAGCIESRSLLLAGVIVADAVLAFVGIQGSELVNAGVATGAVLLGVASLVLRRDLAEELLHAGILHVLGALGIRLLGLVIQLRLLHVVQIRHDLTAGMQLARGIVLHGHGHGLALVVVKGLLDGDRVIALADGEGDQVLGGAANFLGASQSGLDAAIPNEVGHLIAQKRLALSGRAAKFTLISHFVYPPITARLLQIQFFTRHARSLLRRLGRSGLALPRPYFP